MGATGVPVENDIGDKIALVLRFPAYRREESGREGGGGECENCFAAGSER